MSGTAPTRKGTNRTRVAWDVKTFTALSGATTYGRVAFTAGHSHSEALEVTPPNGDEKVLPSAFTCGTGGLFVFKNAAGVERAITAVAGVEYPITVSDFDGTNTAASDISFFYNA